MNSNYKKKGETKLSRGIREYPELRQSKESVEEIAKVLNCTTQFIYSHIIPAIVEKGEYSHDELIYIPHKPAQYTTKPGRPKGRVNKKDSLDVKTIDTETKAYEANTEAFKTETDRPEKCMKAFETEAETLEVKAEETTKYQTETVEGPKTEILSKIEDVLNETYSILNAINNKLTQGGYCNE